MSRQTDSATHEGADRSSTNSRSRRRWWEARRSIWVAGLVIIGPLVVLVVYSYLSVFAAFWQTSRSGDPRRPEQDFRLGLILNEHATPVILYSSCEGEVVRRVLVEAVAEDPSGDVGKETQSPIWEVHASDGRSPSRITLGEVPDGFSEDLALAESALRVFALSVRVATNEGDAVDTFHLEGATQNRVLDVGGTSVSADEFDANAQATCEDGTPSP